MVQKHLPYFQAHPRCCFYVSYASCLYDHDLNESLLELRVRIPYALQKGLVTREDEKQQTELQEREGGQTELVKQGYVEIWAHLGTHTQDLQ